MGQAKRADWCCGLVAQLGPCRLWCIFACCRKFAFGSKKVTKVRGEEISSAAATTSATAAASAADAAAYAAAPVFTHSAAGPSASTSGAAASGASAGGVNGTGASTSGTGAADAEAALAGLVVSEQDRALVARGRGVMGLTDQVIVVSQAQLEAEGGGGGVGGGDYVLLGLTRCTVVLLGRLRALRAAGLRGCTVVAGPVTGACFLDDVRDCTLALATYQVGGVHITNPTRLRLGCGLDRGHVPSSPQSLRPLRYLPPPAAEPPPSALSSILCTCAGPHSPRARHGPVPARALQAHHRALGRHPRGTLASAAAGPRGPAAAGGAAGAAHAGRGDGVLAAGAEAAEVEKMGRGGDGCRRGRWCPWMGCGACRPAGCARQQGQGFADVRYMAKCSSVSSAAKCSKTFTAKSPTFCSA